MAIIQQSAFCFEYSIITRELCFMVNVVNSITKTEYICKCVWDTGATGTAISQNVVNQLGLIADDIAEVHTAKGLLKTNVYTVDLSLPHPQSNIKTFNLSITGAELSGCDVLIGMDIISQGDMNISNHNGKTLFSFSCPPHEKKINLVERANKVNQRLAKKS